MDKKRLLVIAGTHNRENEFSYSAADKLIDKYGAKEPDYVFQGSDGARQGRLWLYDGIAIAKIDKVGETSSEYLQTLSYDELADLTYFKLSEIGCKHPSSIDSRVGNRHQWTSVTQQLIDASNANMYVDLHSYHSYSQSEGTGLYINLNAREEAVDKMKKSLDNAKREEPEIYGLSDKNPFDEQENIASEICNDTVKELGAERKTLMGDLENVLKDLDKSQLVNVLEGNYDPKLKDLVSNLKEVNSKVLSYEGKAISILAQRWGNLWYLVDNENRINEGINGFTFEAVHWKEEQQNAVVNFIDKYLQPNV